MDFEKVLFRKIRKNIIRTCLVHVIHGFFAAVKKFWEKIENYDCYH